MKPSLEAIEVDYEWVAGSMPPPQHFRYTIRGSTAAGAQGELVFVPGYAFESPPRWVSSFAVERAAAASLARLLDQHAVWTRAWQTRDPSRGPAVGGSQRTLHFRRGDTVLAVPQGLEAQDRGLVDEIEAAVRALVPEALWREIRERHAVHKARLRG